MRLLIAALLLLASVPAYAQKVCDFSTGAPLAATDYLTISKNCAGTRKASVADVASYVYANAPGTDGQVLYRSGGSVVSGNTYTIASLLGLTTVAFTGDYEDLSSAPELGSMAFASTGAYYTASAVDSLLSGKSDTGHSHNGLAPAGGSAGQVLKKSSGTNYDYAWAADDNTSQTTSGTTNRITVSSGSANPVIDIAATYVGQSSITTVGTISTGVWQGTAIGDGYISSAATWSAKQAGDATLTALAGVTTAADKVIYATGSDAFSTADLPSYGRTLIANTSASDARIDLGLRANEYCWSLSDFNTTAVTAATGLAIEYLPAAFTVTGVRAYARTAPTGLMTIDVNEANTSILSTKLTIDANEKSSGTAATAAVISDTAIAANAEITIDVDSTTGGKGLVVCMEGTF